MSRFHVFAAMAALLLSSTAFAQTQNTCGLKLTLECSSSGACTATTTNGPATCAGTVYTGLFLVGAASGGNVTNFSTSLGLPTCYDTTTNPVPGENFAVCFGPAALAPNGSFTATGTVTGVNPAAHAGIIAVTEIIDDMGNESFAMSTPTGDPCTPVLHYPTQANSGTDYTIAWDAITSPGVQYTVVETDDSGKTISSTTTSNVSMTFNHVVATATRYHYAVTPTACASGAPGTSTGATVVVPPLQPVSTKGTPQAVAPLGSTQPVSIPVTIPGVGTTATFTATTNKPYLTVDPSTGSLPPSGTTVNVIAAPGSLTAGTNTGTLTVTVTTPGATGHKATSGTTTTNTPVAVSIVTPVQASGIATPPPNALVIPVVTHVNAAAGPFVTDVRLANAGSAPANYLVTMAPAGSDATKSSQSTTITVPPQSTTALNDIVKNFFGVGATGAPNDTGFGALQIQPLDPASTLNFAASRTYTIQSIGTFGQFIAAIPFSKFATLAAPVTIPGGGTGTTNAPTKLSLQQVAASSRFRTNFGIAEGSGQPASGVVRLFDDSGKLVNSVPFNLNPGEVQQHSLSELSSSITDGRLEIEITSPAGAVTGYASVIDNGTTDPFAVAPVDPSSISATRYVLPGISEFTNATSNFHSDVRIFNAGTNDVTATLNFYPLASLPGASAKTVSIPAGHVAALDNILPQTFGVSATGGSVIVTTPSASSLIATANTYSISAAGTFGQFIPGVQSTAGVGNGERALQVLQLEQSDRFRSNVGIAELTGNAVDVELSLYQPDSKVTPFTQVHLEPNQFVQLNSIIATAFGVTDQTYNARVSVQVVAGSGRVAAYGSVIDNQSSDPTYVPAQ